MDFIHTHSKLSKINLRYTQRRQSVTRNVIDVLVLSGSYFDTIMITAMSKPLPNLPADVWFYIFQLSNDECDTDTVISDECDTDTVISLASVNKFLRGIGLPFLLRTLDLRAPKSPESNDDRYIKSVIQRIRDINASPNVLNVVRRLTLTSWWICPDDDSDMSDGSIESDDYSIVGHSENNYEISKPKVDGYREISALISHLPRLDHLACYNCSFTLEFLSHILGIPTLQSLYIHNNPIISDYPTECQIAVGNSSLCIFQYFSNDCQYQPRLADTVQLFTSLIGQFTVFSFPLDILTHVLADNSLPIALPKLQKLSMFTYDIGGPDNHDDLDRIHNFLRLTPNLCELRIISDIHMETPFIISDTAIPHLKTLIAPPYIANGIASGRALEKLHILPFRREFRDSYTVVSRDIKHVIYSGTLNNPEDLFHFAQVFPKASTVEITDSDVVSYIQTFQELSDMVLSILPRFRHLKQCTVSSSVQRWHSDSESYYESLPAHCPVGRADDPKYRSHPTLEELQIFNVHRWIWCPKDGWHSVRSPGRVDAFYSTKCYKHLRSYKY